MKSVVRSYVWWPKMDNDIETYVKTCQICQRNGPQLHATSLNPWNSASYPLESIHVDFSGPVDGSMWMVLIDAFTKWIEVVPKSIISDDGKQFYSENYIDFCRVNSIKLIRSGSYHSRMNGMAERAFRALKDKYMKMEPRIPANRRLAQALYFYRNTQTSITLKCPSELMLGRKLRGYTDNNQP
ncbi:hypothetical protein RF11_06774 [Thelohanellus kitauei]|uniref:Integrase catalytic domain-containing protein n=1 Tax=Thelohanellus kitauei TaxID=669202 RepID=A0A0C2MVX6_THEKT|nr:hypothetical protein RF11_06774 [Thelohanellus kitauei]